MVKSKLFIGIYCLLGALSIVQANEYSNAVIDKQFWQSSNTTVSVQNPSAKANSKASSGLYFDVDFALLQQQLLDNGDIVLDLPLPDGSYATFKLTSSRVMHPELAAKYPSIKTFSGFQIDAPANKGQFDITPQGFHGVFNIGNEQVFIDPSNSVSNRQYHNYYRKDAQPLAPAELTKRLPPRKYSSELVNKAQTSTEVTSNAITTQLTTYRLAIATTGEYAAFHGGTTESTLAALVTLVSRLNDVYQRDLSMTFELVANNDSIIFTDSSSDPFDNTDNDIELNAGVIDGAIGANNYDIGHLVGTGAGGIAGFRVVCTSIKAEGVTGSSRPTSDAFYIDYVAHEIGHQFGADHTFNGGSGFCGGNWAFDSAYEPGSGSTIMAYAGICDGQNIQNSSDPYFHIHSIDQIRNYVAPLGSCGSTSTFSNDAPSVDAGADYTIPARTPFTLVGSATDPDNDSLSYSWEQFDLGAQSNSASDDATDDGQRPLFRAFSPVDHAERTFPKLNDILTNTPTHGEALPTQTRELNFRLVVRDNQNNLVDDAMKVNVVAVSQGFSVNDIGNWNGSSQTVTWQTANTENAPVSCSAVDILLSTDSGQNFSQTLASGVSNDGSHDINLTNLTTTQARVKVACNNNIFFAINNSDFAINVTDSAPTKPVFSGQNSITTNEDTSIALNAAMLSFENNPSIDTLQVLAGDNYSFSDLNVLPNTNFNGSIMVNMTATTSGLVSDVFQVAINVTPVNDQPTAEDDTATVAQDSSANSIDVLLNDSDLDGDTLTLKTVTTNGSGSVEVVDNKVSYTPAAGFSGSETITYTVEDIVQASVTAELVISVTATPVAPTPTEVETESSSSGSGSIFYLLFLMLIAASQRFKPEVSHEQ